MRFGSGKSDCLPGCEVREEAEERESGFQCHKLQGLNTKTVEMHQLEKYFFRANYVEKKREK